MTKEFYTICNIERKYSKKFDNKSLKRDNNWKLKIAKLQKELSSKLKNSQKILKSCPICKSINFSFFVKTYGFKYVECNSCGHIFCQTPAKNEAIKALYENDKKLPKSSQSEIYLNPDLLKKRINDIATPKVKFLTERIKKLGKWMDIGCGAGELIIAANNLGWKSVGIESDPDEVVAAQKNGINVRNVFLNEKNVAKYIKDFDVISLINVLEHIPLPLEFLHSISKVIKKNTFLLIEVPRHPSLSSLSSSLFPNYSHRHIYPPDHLHIFTEKSISLILENSKLKPVAIWCFGQDVTELFSSLAIFGDLKNNKLFDNILNISNKIQSVVDKNNLSDTMLLIVKKI